MGSDGKKHVFWNSYRQLKEFEWKLFEIKDLKRMLAMMNQSKLIMKKTGFNYNQ